MTTILSFLDALAERTHPERAATWDPVGLQFGNPERGVRRVAVCHEVSEEVTSRLLEDPVDLVVTYHPLLFRPTNRLVASSSPAGRAWRLISAGIALAATHTDFDAAPGGTADALAEALDLAAVERFAPVEEEPDSTEPGFIGRVGSWSGTLEELTSLVAGRLGESGLRVAGDPHGAIERVAVVPGSGSSFVGEAGRVGADALVTGDVDHHRAVSALDEGLAVIDPGHAATELPGMKALVDVVSAIGVDTRDMTGDGSGPWQRRA